MVSGPAPHKLVYICDWLPPDFGAVGQYSLLFARERAARGERVVLAGLSSTSDSVEQESIESGSLEIRRLRSANYNRASFWARAIWTARTNLRLLLRLRDRLRSADEIVFTGSPPFLIHFIVPINLLLRKKLVYRITDFYPECLIAELGRTPFWLGWLYKLTIRLRHRIHTFEALGEDQRRRLVDAGIPEERVQLKRDPSPVEISENTVATSVPLELGGYQVLLYSGNFGVAHDQETFLAGYRLHHAQGTGSFAVWLNATGARAGVVEERLRLEDLPFHRTLPGPLDRLPGLLLAADAHLITLRDEFVGFVLPSKVYACVLSRRPVLFVGSGQSDIHAVCSEALPPELYFRVDVGDVEGVAAALDYLGTLRRDSSGQDSWHQEEPNGPESYIHTPRQSVD